MLEKLKSDSTQFLNLKISKTVKKNGKMKSQNNFQNNYALFRSLLQVNEKTYLNKYLIPNISSNLQFFHTLNFMEKVLQIRVCHFYGLLYAK